MADSSLFQNAELGVPEHAVLTSASGDQIGVIGMGHVKIKLSNGVEIVHKVAVVNNFPWKLLLGNDFNKKYGVIIDFKNCKVNVHVNNVVAEVKFETNVISPELPNDEKSASEENFLSVIRADINMQEESGVVCKIVCAHDVVIEPNVCQYIDIKQPILKPDCSYIFEPSFKLNFKNRICCSNTFVDKNSPLTGIWVSNMTPRRRILFAGTALGNLEYAELVKKESINLLTSASAGNEEFDINPHLTESEKNQMKELLSEFKDVFAFNSSQLGLTNAAEHVIDTGGAEPIKQRAHRTSHKEREIIDSQVTEMKSSRVIRPSQSPWASPVVLIRKKDGTWRFCVDYRKLNSVSKKDTFPLPVIDDLLSFLGNAKYFSSFDLLSSYHQVPIRECDREKTAFICHSGLYEFNVLSFGLCNAPATFQRMGTNILGDMLYKEAIIYLDDILLYNADFSSHLSSIRKLLERMRDNNLTLKVRKTKLAYPEIKILGHTVNSTGVLPDSEKLDGIAKFKVPETVREVQSFLGTCSYYRKFVKNFAHIARPLYDLTRKSQKFDWTPKHQKAFEILKEKMLSAPVLVHFDPKSPTELHVDASNYGIGAVVLQERGGEMHPVAYGSRSLSKAEMNYSCSEREALGCIWGLTYFRHLIWGRPVKIYTDHNSLRWLKSIKSPSGRLARWAIRLEDFDYSIAYKPGSTNLDVDGLSRCPVLPPPSEEEAEELVSVPTYVIEMENIAKMQRNDKEILEIINAVNNVDYGTTGLQRQAKNYVIRNDILYRKNSNSNGKLYLLVIPPPLRHDVMTSLHSEPLSGHLGFAKTYDKIQLRFYWIGMRKDVAKFCKLCVDCQTRKGQPGVNTGKLQPLNPGQIFHRWGIDLLGPFTTSSQGMKRIVVATEYATRFALTRALPSGKAADVAKFIYECIICQFGAPLAILSDQGVEFQAGLTKELLRCMGVNPQTASSMHPQTNGLTERLNKTLAAMLSMYVDSDHRNWCQFLPSVTFAYNTSKQESIGVSPFKLMYGVEAILPADAALSQGLQEEYPRRAADSMLQARQIAAANIQRRQAQDKRRYDKKHAEVEYKIGQKVLIYTPRRYRGRTEKLLHNFYGPYTVVEKLSPVNYRVRKLRGPGRNDFTVHVNRMKKFFD